MLPLGIDHDFPAAMVEVAKELGGDPFKLAALLFNESGIHPEAKNSIGCVGINQFCKVAWKGAGIKDGEAYLKLTASEQLLGYVGPWWKKLIAEHHAEPTARDIYWLNFLPATYVPAAPDSHVICRKDGANPQWYRCNPGFDFDKKGFITAGDLDAAIRRAAHGPRWDAVETAIFTALEASVQNDESAAPLATPSDADTAPGVSSSSDECTPDGESPA